MEVKRIFKFKFFETQGEKNTHTFPTEIYSTLNQMEYSVHILIMKKKVLGENSNSLIQIGQNQDIVE